MRAWQLALLFGSGACGCYLSHARLLEDASIPAVDGGRDAGRDGGLDAPLPSRCDRIVIGPTASLDGEARGAVTPRLVGLPDGSAFVVSVRTDGAPTRVLYELRDAGLSRLVGPRTLATDSFTWAEGAFVGERVLVAFGLGGGLSAIDDHGIDGSGTARVAVALEHPSIFRPLGSGLLWASFDSRATNALVVAEVGRDGAVRAGPERIELGRYGSGHSAGVRPDGARAVLGYPREEGRGVRRGFVRSYEGGVLGPERMLDDGDVREVRVVSAEGGLVVVWNGDRLGLERDDWATLEPIERVVLPPLDGTFLAGAIGERTVVARFASGRLHVDVYDAALSLESSDEVAMPGALGAGTSIAAVPGALVVAAGVSDGGTTYPWLARIECGR